MQIAEFSLNSHTCRCADVPVPACDCNRSLGISGAPASATAAREAVDITDIVAGTGREFLSLQPAPTPGQQSWQGTAAASTSPGAGAAGTG